MDREELKARTKVFAVRVVKMTEALPRRRAADIVARQLIRSATAVGANYRAACRARSRAEFLAKLGIVEEEADESVYWMELLIESGTVTNRRLGPLMREAQEILAIVVSSINTARSRQRTLGKKAGK